MSLNTASVLPYQIFDLPILCTAVAQLFWSVVSFEPNFHVSLLECVT